MGGAASVDSVSLDLSNDEELTRQILSYYKEGPERFDKIVAEVRKRAADSGAAPAAAAAAAAAAAPDAAAPAGSGAEGSSANGAAAASSSASAAAAPAGSAPGVLREIIEELNLARCQPQAYAAKLAKGKEQFDGVRRNVPGLGATLVTKEGWPAVQECIDELENAQPLEPLSLEMPEGMARAARDHCEDTGPKGLTGHAGSDGSSPSSRLERYGQWKTTSGENLSYGWDSAEMIVAQLMVDDGVASRGHRKNILNPKFKVVGLGVGKHKTMRHMCCMTLAGGYGKKIEQAGTLEATTMTPEMAELLGSFPAATLLDKVKETFDGAAGQPITVKVQYTPKDVVITATIGDPATGQSIQTMKANW